MAVYKIFPSQDTTLYSGYPLMNTGLDSILEISNTLNLGGSPTVARYLIQFDNDEIQDIINNKINGDLFDVYLKNFISTAQGISTDTSLEIYPIAQSWNNGTGYYLDSPQNTTGASWYYSNPSGSTIWSPSGSTGGYSYTSSFNLNYSGPGGGNWFLTSSLTCTQSFELRSVKDLEVKVDNIVTPWYSSSIPNYGFIIKLDNNFEFNSSSISQPILKYYSVDTNTIYPPQLEFRWRDYSSITIPLSSIINTPDLKLSLSENPEAFYPDSVNRFYVNVSPLYPARVYQTSSLFTNLKYLPTSSYYAVKDLATNEFVINFDEQYTQISANSKGNYFDIYMSGLEPERYYKILIKTIIDGSTLIFDDNDYFKVIN
jgi:hypothetical protein